MSGHLSGDLLVAEVVELGEFGAVLRSEDYDGEVFLHVSEVPLKREQKLTDVVRKNQLVVVKALKEDGAAKRLFVSLKGISKSESRSMLRSSKDDRSARAMLTDIAKKNELPASAVEEVEARATEKFGSLSEAFRAIAETGDKALAKLRLPTQVGAALKRELESELLKKRYVEKRIVEVYFVDSDGAEKLRSLGKKYVEDKKTKSSVTIRSVSSPKYEIVVESRRPKEAKAAIEEIVERMASEVKALGGSFKA
jgi:translation initiation factor 2 alpha subunit (eIF-2alpha)